MESQLDHQAGREADHAFPPCDLNHKSNYQDFGRYAEVDLAIAADAEATLPALIEAVQAPDHRRSQDGPSQSAARSSPKPPSRLASGLREQAADRLGREPDQHRAPVRRAVGADQERRLVAGVERQRSSATGRRGCGTSRSTINYIGGQGAAGIGYGAPAAVGAALANRKHGRLTVNIQCDGDLNYAPGVLWTAAHHHIPLLTIMHNNRALSSGAHVRAGDGEPGESRHRPDRNRHRLNDPNIDYAKLAKAYGMYGEGPISDPEDLGPAIQARHRGGEARRAGADRRGHAAALRRMEMKRFYPMVLAAAGLLLGAYPASAQGNAENGKKFFVKNGCYQCHGYAGQGGSAGARLAPRSDSSGGPDCVRPASARWRHAGLHRQGHVGRGADRCVGLPEIDSSLARGEGHSVTAAEVTANAGAQKYSFNAS